MAQVQVSAETPETPETAETAGTMSTPIPMTPELEHFLSPLHIDVTKAHVLSHEFHRTFQQLAAESLTQFLPTPISESTLRPTGGRERGRYVSLPSDPACRVNCRPHITD